jgi:AcrR family transcriptional regulator
MAKSDIRPGADAADLIADVAIRLAAANGWRSLSLAEIAGEAGLPLSDLARHYRDRPAILDGFERMIDRRMLAGVVAGDIGDAPRDRLFDVIMERLDALLPYRDGLRRIAREIPLDPSTGLVLACALPRSVAWMYAGARIAIGGPTMPIRIAALAGAYLVTLRTWLDDESADLAKTMAILDRQLDRAKRLTGGEFGRTRPSQPPSSPQPPPDMAVPEPPKQASSGIRRRRRSPQRRKKS